MVTMNNHSSVRLISIDAFRGLTMLLLIPDVFGGFSFHEMARRFPDSAIWSSLSSMFNHAQWSGATIWDLIMPAFVFIVGVSIPYSYTVRKQHGDSDKQIFFHALLRAFTLIILGVTLLTPIQTMADFLWPFLILALGLPVPAFIFRILRIDFQKRHRLINAVWLGSILSFSTIRLFLEFDRIPGFHLGNILSQIGLSYVFAFLLVNRIRVMQGLTAATILAIYWFAFLLYPPPSIGFDLATVGVLPSDETYIGYFAHWNKNTNLAAAFDLWFLNLFPRPEPFLFNSHGYQTLNFIPTIVSMIFGVMVGEYLQSKRPRTELRNGLFAASGLAILGGVLGGWLLCPVVKSIWTPSWVLFSTGCILTIFAFLYHVIDVQNRRRWTFPLVVAGRNPLLLYILALNYRWWVLAPLRHTVGLSLSTVSWAPVLESVICGFSLWLLALALYRFKIFIRL